MTSCKSTRLASMAQGRGGREYSPSRKAIYSPMIVEQDQKQIIISRLKEEIQMLQKNSIQINELKEHYRQLDQQYHLLQNQKKVNDSTFAKYHESALKQICSMKNQIDSMKVQFRQKKLQIEDLFADENTLHNQLDQKQIQIEKFKNDLRSSIADNQELASEKQKLVQIHRTVAQERQRREDDCKKMEDQIDKVEEKIEQLTKYYASLNKQQKALTSEIIKFEELNNKADDEITTTSEDLAILNDKVSNSEAYITDLQKNIAETGGLSEKLKSECLHAKKSIQSELMKNNDTLKNIQQSDSLLTIRINQVKQGHRQLDQLNEQNVSLQKINTQLQDDMQACKRHLQNLSMLNNQLVKHMQAASEEDEQVRELIDRKGRVERSTLRVRQREQERKEGKKVDQSTITSSRYHSKRRYY